MTESILVGDVFAVLPTLPEKSVHTCVTSPPYWGLRSYLPGMVQIKSTLSEDERAYVLRELDKLGIKPVTTRLENRD